MFFLSCTLRYSSYSEPSIDSMTIIAPPGELFEPVVQIVSARSSLQNEILEFFAIKKTIRLAKLLIIKMASIRQKILC